MAEKHFATLGESSVDEEPDVHICGKCKKQFTELSKYVSHKQEKNCHDGAKKISRTPVKDLSKVGMSHEKIPTDGTKNINDDSQHQDTDMEAGGSVEKDDAISVQISQGNVEVQILEPLEPQEFLEVGVSSATASHSTRMQPDHVYSKAHAGDGFPEKASTKKKNKRKNSTPKTTRKRSDRKKTSIGDIEMDASPENITVHIPESQLVHLMPPSSKSGKVIYRKQAATSVLVPIFVAPVRAKTFKCSKCPAEFRSKEEQQGHLTLHKKEFKCAVCSKAFYTSEGLQRHQDRESHSHPCEKCERVFPLEVLLKRHAQSHSKERAFICDVCEKGYPSEISLQSHKRNVHAAEKKHKCPECGKAFVRKDKMKRHELIHFPDTRPTFPCPFRTHLGCTKTFYREDKLKRHLFTHSDVKPYKCDICEKTFARRDNLTDHMRIHTGLFGNPCHVCKKGFQGPNRLKKHLKSAHGIVPEETLPTMVSRESSTGVKTMSSPPLTGNRSPSTAAISADPNLGDFDQGSEGSEIPEFGSSFDSEGSEEKEESEPTQQLPSISKLASQILPRVRANPRFASGESSGATCTVTEMMGVSPDLLSMVNNVNNFQPPQ